MIETYDSDLQPDDCRRLEKPTTDYDGLQEVDTIEEVIGLLNNPQAEPRGAIRYHGEDGERIALVFWFRRARK